MRAFYPMTAFNSVLGIGVKTIPPTYAGLAAAQRAMRATSGR